ncbi:hypothetical protein [Oceanispirochaeta sp.]|jgi:protein tyrosine phosphatase (PTP) superfamily phosphohydrolase (DUF442 family)|uniref:hypothetical protein n=1 Tax=Oceanispirochaeta sp. TaxID=2035350 RepID=UPI0026213820|nr:hypothetical protein [Oceanispirochaeta sp.]MDA3956159.1 hypothetical protein [Oceanispirochaeta sp.]
MSNNIPRYFEVNETYATGAQPSIEGLELLKEKGFTAVLNLSPGSTPNYLPSEAEAVESLDMTYVHYPVDCSNLRSIHYNMFSGILKGFGKEKVFIHCGGNIKSSNLMHMYNVLEEKLDEKESYNQLLQIQQPEEKWHVYFRQFGLTGISA